MPSKSKKQARLMAAVAHNPKFAKKVGISQAVGREFNDADRTLRKYAEGGKVLQALRFLKLGLRNREMPVISNPATAEDIARLKMAMKEVAPDDNWLRTWESENNTVAFPASAGIHEQVIKQLEREYPNEKFTLGLGITLDEILDQITKKGKFSGRDSTYDPYADARDLDEAPSTKWAEGGRVLPTDDEEGEPWTDTYLKRPLSGLASMWGGVDPESGGFVNPAWHNLKRAWNADERRRQGLPPEPRANLGIASETAALPALSSIIGIEPPEFATRASDESDATRTAARDAMGIDAPHGFLENLTESAGVMAGQLPVPASVAKKLELLKKGSKFAKSRLGKAATSPLEWFSPTVVPTAGNYLRGTLFGGMLSGGLDHAEDYLDERRATKNQKQWIAEAMDEVLAEERGETGDDDTDDEALAELGYAEGGRVKTARKAVKSLKAMLSEAEPPDPATRKAALDAAVRAISTPGVSLPFSTRNLLAQRGEDDTGLFKLLQNTEALLQQSPVKDVDPASLVRGGPPPAQVVPADLAGRGKLSDEEYNKILGLAKGGEVFSPAPQSQKDPASQAAPRQTGAPLSQEWYETYGEGPEHLFMGDRTVNLHPQWGPQHSAPPPGPVQRQPDGSWLPAAGLIGLSLYDEWKNRHQGTGTDASQQAFWQDMHNSAANTSDTDAWVDQQLEQYRNTAPMPYIKDDGTAGYMNPSSRDFWQNIHEGAADTSDTDAWVNEQLDAYGDSMEMPNPQYDEGFDFGNAWEGAKGAFGLYGGIQQGGLEGTAQALSGASNLYGAIGGPGAGGGYLGQAGGTLGGLSSIYGGLQQGGVEGYTQAAGGALQTANALGYNAAGGALGMAGKAIPLAGAALSAYGAYESAKVGDKKGAVTQGAAAGAAIGSVVPVIGTAVGAVIGAVVGLIGASLGNKENPSELAYAAHKKLDPNVQTRNWTQDQMDGAIFETIKSHTKSGNVNKFKDVGEMYAAFGINKDAHENMRVVQTDMNNFIKGVVETAQQMGALPTDPMELRQLDGQKIFYDIVTPALAAKYKEATGKESEGWKVDRSKGESALHNLFADYTDWTIANWGKQPTAPAQSSAVQGGIRSGGGRTLERARGGRVGNVFDYDPRSGALSLL